MPTTKVEQLSVETIVANDIDELEAPTIRQDPM